MSIIQESMLRVRLLPLNEDVLQIILIPLPFLINYCLLYRRLIYNIHIKKPCISNLFSKNKKIFYTNIIHQNQVYNHFN